MNIIEEARYGGPHKRIMEVAKEIKKFGDRTIVIIPKKNSTYYEDFLKLNAVSYEKVRMYRVTKDIRHFLCYILFFIPEIWVLVKLIRKHGVNIVHCNGSYQYKGIIASKVAGIQNVWHLNDSFNIGVLRKIFNYLANKYADGFIGASKLSILYYLNGKLLNKPLMLINAPVDVTEFDPDNVIMNDSIPFKKWNVIMVANLNPIKGHKRFLYMADYINKHVGIDTINFFCVGAHLENQSNYISELEAMRSALKLSNVDFLGRRSDVKQILKGCQIYVCSSESESSPISVWEALAMRLPVVATQVGDLKAVFCKYNCGLVALNNSHRELGKHVISLLQNDTLRMNMGLNARIAMIENYDISICAKRHRKIYKQIFK